MEIRYRNANGHPIAIEDKDRIEKLSVEYLGRIKVLESRYNVSLVDMAKKVVIGNESYPFDEIHFKDDLMLFVEEPLTIGLSRKDNEKSISEWLKRKLDRERIARLTSEEAISEYLSSIENE